jgi:hypothetical protein
MELFTSDRDQALLQTQDPRTLTSGQWARYTHMIDAWLVDQGMSEGCTCASSGGDWETFGTLWTKGEKQVMVNYLTMPFVALCILHGQELASLMVMIEPMRR